MNYEEFDKAKQELVSVLDTLFSRTISGTSIVPKDFDKFHDNCATIVKIIGKFSEKVALEKCKNINDAILEGFRRMEKHNEERANALEERIKALENK